MAETKLQCEGVGRLDWLEKGLQEVFLSAGRQIFQGLLNDASLHVPEDEKKAGEKLLSKQKRSVQTIFGSIEITRNGYYNAKTKSSRYPLDEAIELMDGFTPSAAKLVCRASAREPFKTASEDIEAYTGIHIESRRFQRLVQRLGPVVNDALAAEPVSGKKVPVMYISGDGTGVPLRPEELKGRKGKQADGSAKTHEVKLGCVFTQHPKFGEDPFRDLDSTTYVATTHRCNDFGDILLSEARRRNLGGAGETVFISDGAKWLKEIARTRFPAATWILDFYHASEHLHGLVNIIYEPDSKDARRVARKWTKWLLRNKVDQIIAQARNLAPPKLRNNIDKKLEYFENNRSGMLYGTFQNKGYFIGSGVIEAGCKSVIGKRLKQSGMFWSEEGAENMLTFRTALESNRMNDLWRYNLSEKLRKVA